MQVTTRKKNLKSKSDAVLQRVRERMLDKADTVVLLLGDIVPVDTGAYAESMHINDRGDTSGVVVSKQGRTRPGEEFKAANAQLVREDMVDRLLDEVEAIETIEEGFTVVNRAEHANWVEIKVEPVFAQIRGVI